MWDLIVSVVEHCLSFYIICLNFIMLCSVFIHALTSIMAHK